MPPNSCDWTFSDVDYLWTPVCNCIPHYGPDGGPEGKTLPPHVTTAHLTDRANAAGVTMPAAVNGATVNLPCVPLTPNTG